MMMKHKRLIFFLGTMAVFACKRSEIPELQPPEPPIREDTGYKDFYPIALNSNTQNETQHNALNFVDVNKSGTFALVANFSSLNGTNIMLLEVDGLNGTLCRENVSQNNPSDIFLLEEGRKLTFHPFNTSFQPDPSLQIYQKGDCNSEVFVFLRDLLPYDISTGSSRVSDVAFYQGSFYVLGIYFFDNFNQDRFILRLNEQGELMSELHYKDIEHKQISINDMGVCLIGADIENLNETVFTILDPLTLDTIVSNQIPLRLSDFNVIQTKFGYCFSPNMEMGDGDFSLQKYDNTGNFFAEYKLQISRSRSNYQVFPANDGGVFAVGTNFNEGHSFLIYKVSGTGEIQHLFTTRDLTRFELICESAVQMASGEFVLLFTYIDLQLRQRLGLFKIEMK